MSPTPVGAVIVMHPTPDVDALVSALALEAWLKVRGFGGQIGFHFLDIEDGEASYAQKLKITTYKVIQLSGQLADVYEGNTVFHVDCGGSQFDHDHLERREDVSAAQLVAEKLELFKFLPEWKRIIQWAHEADNNTLKGDFNFPSIVRGFASTHTDQETLDFARTLIEGQLGIERMRLLAVSQKVIHLDQLSWPHGSTNYAIATKKYPGFGTVGLIKMPTPAHRGTAVHQLGDHRLSISVDAKYGYVTITTNRRNNRDDLQDWGILRALRQAEAIARGWTPLPDERAASLEPIRGMGWIAFSPNGVTTSVMDGSPKASYLPKHLKTKLSIDQILKIVDELILRQTKRR